MEINKELLKAIRQAQEGKEDGFNKIYSFTYNFVYFRSKTIMKTDDEAWDLLQEVYIVAYKSISKLERPENLYAWLGGIAYNLGMKAYRKKKEVLLDEENEGFFDEVRSTDKDIQPEEYVEDKQTSIIVKELIDQLPELQKVAVIAYYFDEMSVGEIAEKFECSTGTIKSRLNYARKYLKQAVETKERKDNIKLHSLTIPTILFALQMLSEDTTVSAQTAQNAYNGVCAVIGVKATSLTTVANSASNMVGAGAQVSATAAKTSGLVAKFTAASIGSKTAVIALTTVASISLVVGGVSIKNSISNKSSEPVVAVEATLTPVIVKEEIVSVTPTILPETDEPIVISDEESIIFNLIIRGLTDSIESGYIKGNLLTDEQKMGIAYQVLYSLCVPEGNKLGYVETEMPYVSEKFEFEEDQLIGTTFEIPQEDIDSLLNTILGETITEHKAFEGLMYENGMYYLHIGISYAGFKDFWLEDKTISYNYRKSRMYEIISTETTEKKAIQEGIREIGHSGTDGVETIEKSSYRIEFETVEPTKFGRYSITSFESEEINEPITEPTAVPKDELKEYSVVHDELKNYLVSYDKESDLERYEKYEYSEYFIYDWNNNEPPVLIIRDIYNKVACNYYYIQYNDSTDEIKRNAMSGGSIDSVYYKMDIGFVEVTDDYDDYYDSDDSNDYEGHAAYFYKDLNGTNTEELWFWYKNNDKTSFLNLDEYKKSRAEVESLELIKWNSVDDLSLFE